MDFLSQNMTLVEDRRIVRDGKLAIQERDAANTLLREYTWGLNLGGGIGGLLAMRQSGQEFHYLYDGKGNVSAVIDSTQTVVASYRYDTFGRLTTQSGTLDQPYRFSTKQYLADVGLNYYGYRFYSPAMGRWLNRDPLGEVGGVNLYGFVLNNAVNIIDIWGLDPGDSYPTPRDAATQAIKDINPISIKENREYGGTTYTKPDGSSSYTKPVPGGPAGVIIKFPESPPATGWYHTHGAYDPVYDNENFGGTWGRC